MKIQINKQGREFVNKVSKVVHSMIGTNQRITLAYYPQSNKVCERQNRIGRSKAHQWILLMGIPVIGVLIEGVFSAHSFSKYTSTKFSLFFPMYNCEPSLPIDVKSIV